MKIYLLWFNEWEDSYVLGTFETKEQAEKWKSYFIANPTDTDYNGDMVYYSKQKDYEERFGIQEYTVGQLNPNIKVDNLKYVEHLFTESENASKIDGTEPS